MGPPPHALVLVAVALPWITRASSQLNASALRSNATALGIELLHGPVPVPAANKSFWSIAYPENYYDPQCHGRPRMVIEDCECACNALGGTLACIENPEQDFLVTKFPREDYVIGLYQRTAQNPYKGWRWTAAANPTSSFKVWDTGWGQPDDGEGCGVENCAGLWNADDDDTEWFDVACPVNMFGPWSLRRGSLT